VGEERAIFFTILEL